MEQTLFGYTIVIKALHIFLEKLKKLFIPKGFSIISVSLKGLTVNQIDKDSDCHL